MIKLDVEEYCHNCDMFEADVNKICGYSDERNLYTDSVISCKFKAFCDNIKEFLEREGVNHDKI